MEGWHTSFTALQQVVETLIMENLYMKFSLRLKENEQRFILNLEVQMLLKQGQIEVDAGPFIRDFRDSVLIHRNVVEDLNTTIKVRVA